MVYVAVWWENINLLNIRIWGVDYVNSEKHLKSTPYFWTSISPKFKDLYLTVRLHVKNKDFWKTECFLKNVKWISNVKVKQISDVCFQRILW